MLHLEKQQKKYLFNACLFFSHQTLVKCTYVTFRKIKKKKFEKKIYDSGGIRTPKRQIMKPVLNHSATEETFLVTSNFTQVVISH